VKTYVQVFKLEFHACRFKQAFCLLYKLHTGIVWAWQRKNTFIQAFRSVPGCQTCMCKRSMRFKLLKNIKQFADSICKNCTKIESEIPLQKTVDSGYKGWRRITKISWIREYVPPDILLGQNFLRFRHKISGNKISKTIFLWGRGEFPVPNCWEETLEYWNWNRWGKLIEVSDRKTFEKNLSRKLCTTFNCIWIDKIANLFPLKNLRFMETFSSTRMRLPLMAKYGPTSAIEVLFGIDLELSRSKYFKSCY